MKLALLTLATTGLFGAPASGQTTIHVPADQPTIQDAIAAAAGGDTVLVAPGTYVEQIDFLGKAILVASSKGPDVTAIDANQGWWTDANDDGRYAVARFRAGEGAGSMLRGFTLEGPYQDLNGPCIWSAGASPTVIDCKLLGTGSRGVFGDGTFIDCRFQDCAADQFTGSFGGGARSDGTFVGCRFESGFAFGGGGGIYGSPTVVQCEFRGNQVGYDGGGAIYSESSSIVVDSVFVENKTGYDGYHGGAIRGSTDVSGSLFVGNISYGDMNYSTYGGAMAFVGNVDRCTVVDNQASGGFDCASALGYSAPCSGGGIFSAASVTNSILRGNAPNQVDLSAVDHCNVEGGFGGAGIIDVDPLFIDAANGDYRLRADSPCIDAGDPLGTPDADGSLPDLGAWPFTPVLWSATSDISASGGGSQSLEVHAGTARSGDVYWVLGSASGTEPGLTVDGWTLPLVPDGWFAYTLNQSNGPLLPNSLGVVPATGIASAAISFPAGLSPGLVGLELHHAFATVDVVGFAHVSGTSDALGLTIAP